MKLLLFFGIIFFITSCDPHVDLFQGTVTIKAQVNNPRDTILLGDSVSFTFEVPDTINYNNTLIKTYFTSKDGGEVSLFPERIDPATGNFPGDITIGEFVANPGVVQSRISLKLAVINNKMKGTFYFIPTKRGVYFLEGQQNGSLVVNDGNIKAGNTFNFGSIDRHHTLLLSNANPALNMNAYLLDKTNRGLEVYAFFVK